MNVGRPEILVVTQDLALADATTKAAPGEWTDWRDTFSAAMASITPRTRLIVVDAALGGAMARMLVSLFVEQRPGRRAILVQAEGDIPVHFEDENIAVLAWPATPGMLAEAVASDVLSSWMAELEHSLAEEPCETLA